GDYTRIVGNRRRRGCGLSLGKTNSLED
ncbi:hypothetical protein A5E_3088, partial [Vibrio cholerae B33]